jgi:hypothetical protein
MNIDLMGTLIAKTYACVQTRSYCLRRLHGLRRNIVNVGRNFTITLTLINCKSMEEAIKDAYVNCKQT